MDHIFGLMSIHSLQSKVAWTPPAQLHSRQARSAACFEGCPNVEQHPAADNDVAQPAALRRPPEGARAADAGAVRSPGSAGPCPREREPRACRPPSSGNRAPGHCRTCRDGGTPLILPLPLRPAARHGAGRATGRTILPAAAAIALTMIPPPPRPAVAPGSAVVRGDRPALYWRSWRGPAPWPSCADGSPKSGSRTWRRRWRRTMSASTSSP